MTEEAVIDITAEVLEDDEGWSGNTLNKIKCRVFGCKFKEYNNFLCTKTQCTRCYKCIKFLLKVYE